MFYRCGREFILSPKRLGLFCSYKDTINAIQHYKLQPGFRINQDAFSIQDRVVVGKAVENIVYEVIVYLHSEDYNFELEIELGLYGDEIEAQNKLLDYCENNGALISAKDLVVEKIINRCVVGRKEWIEGFSEGQGDGLREP